MPQANPLRVASQDQTGTPIGRLRLTGFVDNGPPLLPRPRRVFDSYAIVFVYDGAGVYIDDAHPHKPINAGDAILVMPNHSHWYGPNRGARWSEIFLVFDGPLFDALAAAGVLSIHDPVRTLAPAQIWRERLTDFAARPRAAGAVDRELELVELVGLLVELRRTATGPSVPRPMGLAREMLAADITSDLDLHDVAESVGLPYETFRKRFRTATGTSPGAFRLDRRIDAAKMLLRMTAMTHAAIASNVGFADEYHFAKRFRARVGVSPRAYRRAYTTMRAPAPR